MNGLDWTGLAGAGFLIYMAGMYVGYMIGSYPGGPAKSDRKADMPLSGTRKV